jgi:hypothetical protein
MLGEAKTGVCSVVDTDAEDCLLVVILPCRPGWLQRQALSGLTRVPFGGLYLIDEALIPGRM